MPELCFKLGEGLENLVRQAYWFENRQEWANNVLDCLVGISEEQKKDILNGDAKLVPTEDGRQYTLVYAEDKEFKVELEKRKKYLDVHYITIAGKTVSRESVLEYMDFVIKRYRVSIYRPALLRGYPEVIMKLEQIRVSMHDEIVRQAGFKKRDNKNEEYLKFASALSDLVDRKAQGSVGYYDSDEAMQQVREMLEVYDGIKDGDIKEIE